MTIYGHDDRMINVLGQICSNVAGAATGSDPGLDSDNCTPDPNEVEPLISPSVRKAEARAAIKDACKRRGGG